MDGQTYPKRFLPEGNPLGPHPLLLSCLYRLLVLFRLFQYIDLYIMCYIYIYIEREREGERARERYICVYTYTYIYIYIYIYIYLHI